MVSYAFNPQTVLDEAQLQSLRAKLMNPDAGIVLRAKGFLRDTAGEMKLYQMVRNSDTLTPCSYDGDQKFVVIGRDIEPGEFEQLLGHHTHN